MQFRNGLIHVTHQNLDVPTYFNERVGRPRAALQICREFAQL